MQISPLRLAALPLTWATLWSGAFVAMKVASDHAGAYTIVGIRCTIAGVIMIAAAWGARKALTRRGLAGTAVVGLLNNAGYLGLMATAMPNLSAGMGAIVTALTPLAVLVISSLRGRALLITQWIGCILGFLGVVGSAWTRLDSGETSWTGVGFSLGAVTCLVAGTVLTPKLVPPGSPWLSTGIQSLAAGVPSLAVALLFESAPELTMRFLAAEIYLIFGASVLAMTMWLTLIRQAGPDRAAVAHFLPPLISIVLGAVLLGEDASPLALAMCVPVAIGVALATMRPRPRAAGAGPRRLD